MSFLFINILIFSYSFSYIIFPLYNFFQNENMNQINHLSNKILYSYLTIGNPPQKIVALIIPNEYPLNIYNNMCEIKSTFIVEKSTTYKSKEYEIQFGTNITLSYLISDKFEFTFNQTNTKQYIEPIIYHYRPYNSSDMNLDKKSPYTCAYIGLKIPKYNSEVSSQSLILQLKKLRVINNHCFFILYNDDININNKNEEGKLIIGDYPDKYDYNKYKHYQLKTIYSLDLENNYNWHLRFNSIYFMIKDKKISLNNYDIIIDISSELIFSPEDYINKTYNYFFKDKINKGLCEKILEENIQYFSCNSLEVIQNFPTLYLKHSFLLYTFELNYNDLFKKIKNKYIFLICNNKEFNNVWKIGKPLLKKYLFLFNYDEKIIGFYNPLIDKNGILIENKKDFNFYKIVIFFLILIIFAFILFFIISKRIYKKGIKNKIFDNKNKPKIQELLFTNIDNDSISN